MKHNSYRTRAVLFAYQIGPPRYLERPDGAAIHHKVCEDLGMDDIAFRYSPGSKAQGEDAQSKSRGFLIQMDRSSGRGGFKLQLDNSGIDKPVRLLMQYSFPPAAGLRNQEIDTAFTAVFDVLGDEWQTVSAEARIRGQVEADGGSATAFFRDRALRFSEGALATLDSEPNYYALKFETPAGDPSKDDSLLQPKREVSLEVLREDNRNVYIEVMSHWPQLVISPGSSGRVSVDTQRIRTFSKRPSEYIDNTERFLNDVVFKLFPPAS